MICDDCDKSIRAAIYIENDGLCDECYNERENIEIHEDQEYRDTVIYHVTLNIAEIELYLTEPKGEA